MSGNIFDNGLVVICESKFTFLLWKIACVWVCILDLSEVLKYELHCDLTKIK